MRIHLKPIFLFLTLDNNPTNLLNCVSGIRLLVRNSLVESMRLNPLRPLTKGHYVHFESHVCLNLRIDQRSHSFFAPPLLQSLYFNIFFSVIFILSTLGCMKCNTFETASCFSLWLLTLSQYTPPCVKIGENFLSSGVSAIEESHP